MAEKYNISIETQAKLEEIQHLLEELRDINAEIAKINGQTFSAINSSAGEFSQTVKKLADAVQNQSNAFENAKKSSQELSTGLDKTKDSVNKFSDELSGSERVVQGFYMELGALGARLATQIPKAFSASISAFGRQEAALQKLTVAVRSNGGNVAELMPIMRDLATELQKITVHGDEQILEMQSLASAMGVGADQMKTVMENAIGLSEALGMDLMTATKAASAAVQGKTELLQRYIPTLDQCATEEAKLAKVQQLASSGFAQAQNRVDTLDGALKQAANAWGDLQEVIGNYFAPTVRAVAGLIKGLSEFLSEHTILTKALTSAVTGLAVSFAFAKVGGLLNVSRMLLGVASATNTATGAMWAFNTAVRANPIGLIAGIAAMAITAIMSLCDAFGELSEEEKKAKEQAEAEAAARKKANEAHREAIDLLNEHRKKQAIETETLTQLGKRRLSLEKEVAALKGKRPAYGEEELAHVQKLVKKEEELAAARKKYDTMLEASIKKLEETSKLQFEDEERSLAKSRIAHEKTLLEAREKGLKINDAEHKDSIEEIAIADKGLELKKKYYALHSHLIKSESDRLRIMAEAQRYGEMHLRAMYEEKEKNREIAEASEAALKMQNAQKEEQTRLELDILRARASGNETLAKEKEGELKISQLTANIFDNLRKEGMSRKELESLQDTARAQAEERYNLEKSVTDEIQRQNLAKNAQAKIEDILLTNKIEQLKAEGKIAAAKELEREREIKRTLAGLQGVSEKDKERLAKTMRKTNDYRDRQDSQALSGGRSGTATPRGGTSGSFGGESGTGRGATPPRKPRTPVTVSDKNLDLYNEWKDAGGEKGTGKQWMDFRNSRNAPQRPEAKRGKARMQAQARGFLDTAAEAAGEMTGLSPTVGGMLQDAASSAGKTPNLPSRSAPARPASPAPAASGAINKKLEAMGAASGNKGEKNEATAKINDNLKSIEEILKSIKSTLESSAEKD